MKYCTGCKKKHEIQEGYYWSKDKAGGYYCRLHVECVGCKKVHPITPYMKHAKRVHDETGEEIDGWWCDKWVKPKSLTPEQKMANMSPAEVMSGVHYGMDKQDYGHEADNYLNSEAEKEGRDELEEMLAS